MENKDSLNVTEFSARGEQELSKVIEFSASGKHEHPNVTEFSDHRNESSEAENSKSENSMAGNSMRGTRHLPISYITTRTVDRMFAFAFTIIVSDGNIQTHNS